MTNKTTTSIMFLTLGCTISFYSAQAAEEPMPSYSPYADNSYPINVYWGDTHVHSSYSPDASVAGNLKIDPAEAFRFARGEQVIANNGMSAKLRRPLDFLVVSDHAEFLGLLPRLRAGDEDLLKTKYGKRWYDMINAGHDGVQKAVMELINVLGENDEVIKSPAVKRSSWDFAADAADANNKPGQFTAFIGYEYTSMPDGGNNLHRVVMFRDAADKTKQVLPFASFDSQNPEDLWTYLQDYEDKTGGQVLAIPHNGNVSNGLMFADKDFAGKALTPEYAKRRLRWEPVIEVTQIKGDSETHPALSPNDEFADYGTWDKGNLLGNHAKEPWMLQYEYARSALKLGLSFEQQLGVNPYQFGMIGSTDSHTGLATAAEDNFFGKASMLEPGAERIKEVFIESQANVKLNTFAWEQLASGYAAVWAKTNTRASLFDALRRREVYATTGPRMTVRFFGGWKFQASDIEQPNIPAEGYAGGVPMGGQLAATGKSSVAPRFLVSAVKDPEGGNLDRIQIIKGWLDGKGEQHEKVYEVALSGDRKPSRGGKVPVVGNTVDLKTATYRNSIGAAQLATFWQDPDFDGNQRAFYYARVIQIPTPRWSLFDAVRLGSELERDTPKVTQERAYTSPIWYSPE
ncbi:MAG: DUF3604 domain-containing protein [Pseudomonadales bacterium]